MLIDFNIKDKIKALKTGSSLEESLSADLSAEALALPKPSAKRRSAKAEVLTKEGLSSQGKGKKISEVYFDIGVAYWLLNPDEGDYSPESLSRKYLHREYNNSRGDLNELYKFSENKIKEYKLEKLFYETEMPLIEVLADMEILGIKLDTNYLKKLEEELGERINDLVEMIYKEAGEPFNINSPKQLSHILFNKLKIDANRIRKTKDGAISTDIETLSVIKDLHPIAEHLINYRELFKLQSTYVMPLRELVDSNGRVHTAYIQTGTSTGRLSSQNPNLQNIPVSVPQGGAMAGSPAFVKTSAGRPVKGEWAPALRKAFIAEKGYRLAVFDYSQIELRILASVSGDPKMMEAFNNDLDIHKMTATNVFNTLLENVTPAMRRMAKTLNFGVIYGMGANAFAKISGLNVVEARKFIQEYFNDFKKIKDWQEGVKAQARACGYVTNLNGRRRWFLEAVSTLQRQAAEAERAAINFPVQGLAADIIKMAMVKISEELKKEKWWGNKARLLLTIHDELLFEIDEGIIKKAVKLISHLMESVYELEVPIKVSAKTGENWGELINE